MPRIRTRYALRSRDVSVVRAHCDGCDPARPCEEHVHESHVWIVTAGAFELREKTGRRIMDPTTATILPRAVPFTVRHPGGPDTCLSLRGPLVDELASRGARQLQIDANAHARLVSAIAQEDELALVEATVALVDVARPGGDRVIADRIAQALHFTYAEAVSLDTLARDAGASVFHACRVFHRAMGTTIAGYRRELRLRHALAMLIDGDAPLADIAAATGFASQSHLTNLFRARFRRTPGRVRAARSLDS